MSRQTAAVGEDSRVDYPCPRWSAAPYLAGLRLQGRPVVVVGAGAVTERRLPLLLAAGARVIVVAPQARPSIARLAEQGRIEWRKRRYETGDLADAWYALVATDDSSANAHAGADAEEQRVFCVRADDASASSAWTPATAEVDGITVGVLAGGDPRRAVEIRALLVEALRRLTRRAA